MAEEFVQALHPLQSWFFRAFCLSYNFVPSTCLSAQEGFRRFVPSTCPSNFSYATYPGFYPLFSTILLGIFHAVLISYIMCIVMRLYFSVINKKLLRRIFWLVSSVIFSLPARVLLLGFSVLPQSDNLAYELIVFLVFLIMLSCTVVGIFVLVYLPVADSMALGRNLEERGIVDIPYDDYYNDSAPLARAAVGTPGGALMYLPTKPGSISFRTMIKDDLPGSDEISLYAPLHIGSPSGSSTPYIPGTKMVFPGLKKPQERADLITYLKQATA